MNTSPTASRVTASTAPAMSASGTRGCVEWGYAPLERGLCILFVPFYMWYDGFYAGLVRPFPAALRARTSGAFPIVSLIRYPNRYLAITQAVNSDMPYRPGDVA